MPEHHAAKHHATENKAQAVNISDAAPVSPSPVPPPALWNVYLVRCVDGSLYCGITTHVERRLAQHNGKLAGGAKCTRARRPVVLEGSIVCADRATASRYERQIKKLAREQKLSALLSLTSE